VTLSEIVLLLLKVSLSSVSQSTGSKRDDEAQFGREIDLVGIDDDAREEREREREEGGREREKVDEHSEPVSGI